MEERVSGTGARREGDGGGADGDGEEGRKEPDPDVAAFEREGFPKMNAKLLGKLNARGLGQKGGDGRLAARLAHGRAEPGTSSWSARAAASSCTRTPTCWRRRARGLKR